MRRILIIGANSYIGNAFEKYMSKKCEEKKENSAKEEVLIDKVHASNGDWKQADYKIYDVVIILAAIVHQKEEKDMASLYQRVNCDMPLEIATKAKQAGVKQLIFMSTAAVYGSTVTCITKDTQPNPDTLYGKTKLKAESKLVEMNSDDFHVAIIRPPMVYGDKCKGNYSRLMRLATYNPIYPKIDNKRSMIHIDNLCSYIDKIIQSKSSGVFFPQDEIYANTIMMVKSIRQNQGKITFLVPGTAWLIKALMKRISLVRKVFGDWYYE